LRQTGADRQRQHGTGKVSSRPPGRGPCLSLTARRAEHTTLIPEEDTDATDYPDFRPRAGSAVGPAGRRGGPPGSPVRQPRGNELMGGEGAGRHSTSV